MADRFSVRKKNIFLKIFIDEKSKSLKEIFRKFWRKKKLQKKILEKFSKINRKS